MKYFIASLSLMVVILLGSCGTGQSQEPIAPADFVVALDTSASHGLPNDKRYAISVATRIREGFINSDIEAGERVVIYTLGGEGLGEVLAEVLPIGPNRKMAVADELYRRIATLPDKVTPAQNTNLLYVLQNSEIRCSDGRGEIWIASDGIPDDARDFTDWRGLLDGTTDLPKPIGKPFAACRSVNIVGLGRVADGWEKVSSQGVSNLGNQWREWSVEAGLSDASDFHALTGF